MAQSDIDFLLEKRRSALLEYSIGQVNKERYAFVQTSADLFELLRMDPLDTYAVQSSWVAEATSCAQQYIHAVYRKLEPGFARHEFSSSELAEWELYSNYPDWAAVQMIQLYPENFINPFVRQRKSSLFKTLENDLNQSRLNVDSVQAALQDYLHAFEQTCDLDVISCYMHGNSPERADYYFIGRQRAQPFQYFWRKAEIVITTSCVAVNPAAWSEWQSVDIQPASEVLDIRPVFWNGRLCVVWAQWRDKAQGQDKDQFIPENLEVNLAFMNQGGQWSAPMKVYEFSGPVDRVTFRLIATVLTGDPLSKDKLGISITTKSGTATPIKAHRVFDVLMRPETVISPVLELAMKRFTGPESVQHALGSQVTVTVVNEPDGAMTPFLGLEAAAIRIGTKDELTVSGFCRPTGLGSPSTLAFTLALENAADTDPKPVILNKSSAGGWTIAFEESFSRDKGTWPGTTTFTLKTAAAGFGGRTFRLSIINLEDFNVPVLVKNTENAAQFLSFELGAAYRLKYARLNSLFGPELVHRSNISVEAVLDWDSQFIHEPAPSQAPDFTEVNGAFDGANGLFFWELFFHLPHLVFKRLHDEDRFAEAQGWLHYLFDPQAIADPRDSNGKPDYWRCRPLAKEQGNAGCEALAPADPDAIGYSAPRHFKILVFCEYVKNLMAWGDWYYRQLTRDSLVAAKLCYVQAGFLMGKPPVARSVSHWKAKTVGDLMQQSSTRAELEAFEQTMDYSLADVPSGSSVAPLLGMLAAGPFKVPVNQTLLDLFAGPGQRLDNLRNFLTLDGKPMSIPLFSPPTDPNQLLRDLAAGTGAGPRPMGGRVQVNAFRWRVSYEAALRAVQALQDYGSQVLNLLERRDRAEQEELQQTHLVELSAFAQTMQEQSIAQLDASVAALELSRAVAQQRADTYKKNYDENVSAVEYEVMDSLYRSKNLSLASSYLKPAAAVIASVPNILGMSNGGHRLDQTLEAISFGLGISAAVEQLDADKKATTEAYRRRRNEWGLQHRLAVAEVESINGQIEAQRHAASAARTSLEQTLRANSQALILYNYLKQRATRSELYGWMLGQLKALHYQAYDAVVSLCITAQNSLSAETADYDSIAPLPQVWLDQRHGLTAGEQLRAFLLGLEREYLQRHERRLELVHTVSLSKLFDDEIDPQTGFTRWATALAHLKLTGSLDFCLTQLMFDRSHPGHYCRQISSMEIDLPVLVGPYENVSATLMQLGSKTAVRATTQSVLYLHEPTDNVPSDVVFNLRSGQQIALSMGIADNGMAAMKPDEGLLNPFENTGAVSCWRLNFPRPEAPAQAAILRSMTDIIIRLRFTAKVGAPPFVSKVTDLVDGIEKKRSKITGQGSARS